MPYPNATESQRLLRVDAKRYRAVSFPSRVPERNLLVWFYGCPVIMAIDLIESE